MGVFLVGGNRVFLVQDVISHGWMDGGKKGRREAREGFLPARESEEGQ